MKGVKFTRTVAPFGAGDTALLPDCVADTVIASGEAVAHQFPSAPHASAADLPIANKAMQPGSGDTQSYKTKRGRA